MEISIGTIDSFRKSIRRVKLELNEEAFSFYTIQKIYSTIDWLPYKNKMSLGANLRKLFYKEQHYLIDKTVADYLRYKELHDTIYRNYTHYHNARLLIIRVLEKIMDTSIDFDDANTNSLMRKTLRDSFFYDYDAERLALEYQKKIKTLSKPDCSKYAKTQMHAIGRGLKMGKAMVGEIFWFEYMGNLRSNSRDRCKTLLQKKHLSVNDLFELDNEQWDGQLKPFYLYAGGWNCVHDSEPDPFYKP